MPQVEVRISDPETNKVMPIGEQGEICARGYQTMIEYYDLPEATAAAIDAEGWLHTGDLGSMDERGYLRITGRLKDMIIRGGMNIYPREIKEVLFAHPDVVDVAVVDDFPLTPSGKVQKFVLRDAIVARELTPLA